MALVSILTFLGWLIWAWPEQVRTMVFSYSHGVHLTREGGDCPRLRNLSVQDARKKLGKFHKGRALVMLRMARNSSKLKMGNARPHPGSDASEAVKKLSGSMYLTQISRKASSSWLGAAVND